MKQVVQKLRAVFNIEAPLTEEQLNMLSAEQLLNHMEQNVNSRVYWVEWMPAALILFILGSLAVMANMVYSSETLWLNAVSMTAGFILMVGGAVFGIWIMICVAAYEKRYLSCRDRFEAMLR